MPHPRKVSNSSSMNRGNSAPELAVVCAMKLIASCCTRRYPLAQFVGTMLATWAGVDKADSYRQITPRAVLEKLDAP